MPLAFPSNELILNKLTLDAETKPAAGVERQQRRGMKPTASPNLWRPLRVTVFRSLLVADVISDVGAFMQNVGAAWLMVSLGSRGTSGPRNENSGSLHVRMKDYVND